MLVCTVSLHRNLSLWRVIPNASRISKADSMNKEKNIKVIKFITFYKFLITVFKRYTGKEYKKEDQKLYDLLCKYGNEERAIERAKVRLKYYKNRGVKESEMIAANNLHVLIDEIKSKIASK